MIAEFSSSLNFGMETDIMFQQRCYLLSESIQDAVAAMTLGALCNYSTFVDAPVPQSPGEDTHDQAQKERSYKTHPEPCMDKKSFLTRNNRKSTPQSVNAMPGSETFEDKNKTEDAGKVGGGFVPASVRLRWLQDGNQHLKSLLADLQTHLLPANQLHTADEPTRAEATQNGKFKAGGPDYGGDKKEGRLNPKDKGKSTSLAALRGRVNRNLFVNHCGLDLKPSELLPTSRGASAALASLNGNNEKSPKGEKDGYSKNTSVDPLKQLTEFINRFEKTRVDIVTKVQSPTPQAEYRAEREAELFRTATKDPKTTPGEVEGKEASMASARSELSAERNTRQGPRRLCSSLQGLKVALQTNFLVILERMVNSDSRACKEAHPESSTAPNLLTELMMTDSNGYNSETSLAPSCSALASLPSLVKEITAWSEALLNMINTCVFRTSLTATSGASRTKLKKIAFDVEGLQLEQEKAVTDGDMQKSEEIYYRQTTLLNSMEPIFDALVKILETYKTDSVSKPLEKLLALRNDFVDRQRECLQREEDALLRVRTDQEKLVSHRKKLAETRAAQEKGLENYLEEWENLYNMSISEQAGCLRTMDQIERRMRELCKEQQFLVQDRLQKLKEEYRRREDAAAFECFAMEHGSVLIAAESTLTRLVEFIKSFAVEMQRGYEHVETYLSNDLATEIEDELLQVHKDRLAQFRQLYMTLGDLQFKKARHLEEVEKKIDSYKMYQEVAMDTLNPKAKVYSQARKSWEVVHKEAQQQLDALNQQCEAEIEAFKRTEQSLLTAGVAFANPIEEVAARNKQRQQKLLEYRKLMESEAQRETQSDNDKSKDNTDSNEIRKPHAPKGSAIRDSDHKKNRDNSVLSKADSEVASPSTKRLPFLHFRKSTKPRKDCDPSPTPDPLTAPSEGVNLPHNTSTSQLLKSPVPLQSLHSMEEKEMRCSPSSNGREK